jgi:hypothetical protein
MVHDALLNSLRVLAHLEVLPRSAIIFPVPWAGSGASRPAGSGPPRTPIASPAASAMPRARRSRGRHAPGRGTSRTPGGRAPMPWPRLSSAASGRPRTRGPTPRALKGEPRDGLRRALQVALHQAGQLDLLSPCAPRPGDTLYAEPGEPQPTGHHGSGCVKPSVVTCSCARVCRCGIQSCAEYTPIQVLAITGWQRFAFE